MIHATYRHLAVAGVVLLAACSSDVALPTGPSRAPSASLEAVPTASSGPGPVLSGLASNVCADVWTASTTPGTVVAVYGCHGGRNQQFALQSSGAITVYDGALCLDVAGGQANNGDAVVVWTCHGGTNQRWTRTAAGELRTAVNGKCLDVAGANPANGTRLVVWTCHGGTNQKWTINDASGPPTFVAPADTSVGTAELPRTTVNTAMPTTTGRTINVAVGGDLQAALDAAAPGDAVVLPAGATYVGNFILRPKANAAGQWITVRTAGALPAEGTRVSPADAAQMPKILTPNAAAAIATAPGAEGWRLVGLEVGLAPGLPWTYFIIGFGDGTGALQNTLGTVPSRLVLDRSYVHASPSTDVRRCVALNSAASAIIDSYLAECHSRQGDSQAIYGWNGPGPFKIQNNHLEGGHEVVAFGGPTPGIAGLIPSDIEVRRNHITRPMSWRGAWPTKNLFELKSGQRVLVEGNVLENNWMDAQNGFAVVLQGLSDENTAPQNRVWDVTLRSNIIRQTAAGINLLSRIAYNGGALPQEPMRRVTVVNNAISVTNTMGSYGRVFQVLGDIRNATIAQNTLTGDINLGMVFDGDPTWGLAVLSNVFGPSGSPIIGNGAPTAIQTFAAFAPDGRLQNNIFIGAQPSGLQTGNYAPADFGAAGILNAGTGDFRIVTRPAFLPASAATPGTDYTSLATMTSGVIR